LSPTMLQGIVDTICDRPGDTQAQRATRSREVADAVQGFEPRDPVELMLAGMAVIHAHLIYDSVRDLVREQDDRLRARGKSTIVALDRVMLGFLREFRIARKRAPAVGEAAEPPREDAVVRGVGQIDVMTKPGTRSGKPNAPREPRELLATPAGPPRRAEPPPLRHAETSVAAMMAVLGPRNASPGDRSSLPNPERAISFRPLEGVAAAAAKARVAVLRAGGA
jgi:hypothetical protein